MSPHSRDFGRHGRRPFDLSPVRVLHDGHNSANDYGARSRFSRRAPATRYAVHAPRFRPRSHCRRATPHSLARRSRTLTHRITTARRRRRRRSARASGRERANETAPGTRSHRSPVSVPPPTFTPINCETTAFPPAHDTSVQRSTALI